MTAENSSLSDEKIRAEIGKLISETMKLQAELMRSQEEAQKQREKHQAEVEKERTHTLLMEAQTAKLYKEAVWYPLLIATGFVGAIIALTKLFL